MTHGASMRVRGRPRRWGRRERALVGLAGVLCLSLATAACDPSSAAPTPADRGSASGAPTASSARIRITPRGGRTNADPDAGISVSVEGGSLTDVTVRTTGDPVAGRLEHGDTVWRSRWALEVDTRYTVRATAVDASGAAVVRTSTFRTLEPSATFSTRIFEGYHGTYGVGMPIILDFSAPIERKAAVERSLELWTSRPVVGAWYWDGDRRLYFRPRSYWPEHTRVRFVGHLNGVESAPGVYGVHTLTQSFRIGRSLIAVADTDTHHVSIYLHKHLFGDWPMSSGKPGDDTPNGTYLTIEKSNPEEMIGPGYDIQVPWSVRFTWSGDFLHDAYWSVGEQGFANVSHGCVNLSPEHAQTYYELSVPGDPVTITGSPRAGRWDNGWTVWFLTWPQFLQGSALHEAVRAGPHGSSSVEPATLRESRVKAPLGRPRPGNAEADQPSS